MRRRPEARVVVIAFAAVLFVAEAVLAGIYTTKWKSTDSLMEYMSSLTPRAWPIESHLAGVRQRERKYDEAIKHSSSPSDFALQFRGVSGGSTSFQGGSAGSADVNPGALGHDDFEIDRFGK